MKRKIYSFFVGLLAASAVLCVPYAAFAQAWGIGPDGKLGYITTRLPISPNCTPPQVWTLTNGHYSCQNPIPPAPTCGPGYVQTAAPVWNGSSWVGLGCQPSLPPTQDPQAVCMANKPSAWVISGPYQGRKGAPPAGQTLLDYAGSGDQGITDKCGNPVVMNHLSCFVRTSDSAFIQWSEGTDFGTGSCGH